MYKIPSGYPGGIAYLGIEIRQNLAGLISSSFVIHPHSYVNFVNFIEFSGFILVHILFIYVFS